MRDKIFHAGCFGFIFGVLLRSFFLLTGYFSLMLAIVAGFLILFYFLATQTNRNKWIVVFGIFILAFSLGVFRMHSADTGKPDFLKNKVGQKMELTGIITDDMDRRETNQKLTILVREGKEKTKILASVGLENDFQYGDEVRLLGDLELPENFTTDQGKEFDYVNYLRKNGILYVMNFPKIEVLSSGHGLWIKSTLFSVKEKFLGKINSQIRSPESLLMGGLILGEKSSFDETLRQNFVNTGTIHIIALSGYNVTIVAEWIMKVFKFLPHNFGITLGIFAILLFIIMTGASSTAIRAGIMAVLMLFARATGRNYDAGRALLLAALFMILVNPLILAYDVSFQLSFIATVAVIFFAPRVERYFIWVTKKFELRDIVSVTTAAYLFVLPFILYKMGNLSLVALPANVLILPFIPMTMLFGFLTGVTGFVWSILAVPFGFVSYLLLHYELFAINLLARFSFSALSIPNFPLIFTLAIYTYFIYLVFGRDIKEFFTL